MHQKGASSAVKAPGLLLFASTPDPEGYSGAAFCINGIALGLPLRCKKQQAASLRAMGSELKAAKGPVKASRLRVAVGELCAWGPTAIRGYLPSIARRWMATNSDQKAG